MKSEYDKFAENFSETRKKAWDEFGIIADFLQKNDRILDLGCGNGRFREFLEKGKIPSGNYFGLDISAELLKIAQKKFPDEHFFKNDFEEKLPFGNDNFDCVVGIASFHHILEEKSQIKSLTEISRVLKMNGKFMATSWNIPQKHFWTNLKNWSFWKSSWKNYLIPFGTEKFPRNYRIINIKNWEKLLQKTGFKIVKITLFKNRNWIVVAEKI